MFQVFLNYFQPFPTISSHFQPFPTIFSHSQPFLAISSHFQLFPIISTNFRKCPVITSQFPAISSHVQLIPPITSNFKPFPAVSSHLQLILAISAISWWTVLNLLIWQTTEKLTVGYFRIIHSYLVFLCVIGPVTWEWGRKFCCLCLIEGVSHTSKTLPENPKQASQLLQSNYWQLSSQGNLIEHFK